ncbi:carboxypeptidase regulatory-like domain-containing protein [Pseudalkalibacillus berkeleyi]|uniref:Carboxypeptidase regulatory-like domain-containing protein n=1 Tax=Pseudalkalibacillus berkeleyi TaxID=1069813 RepID=A0ABS9H1U5_9BACL|nr:carboxypeptidase regulatory-like domain-containing protein [Pseudalkalibacillus berkeleyi]MCF6137925.1 carboxypeptidase regulatory-like domain-containing protein [Pseudalkalibacillus berkeleyi]
MTFPNDVQYTSIPLGAGFYFDVTGDISPKRVDLVGDQSNPSFLMAYDGTNVYFRLRLREDPRNRQKTGFRNNAWGVLFNTGGQAGTYQWMLNVDGRKEQVNLIQNTIEKVNSWNDRAEGTNGRGAPNYSTPIINFDVARVTPTNTRFGNDDNVFLDFFIPAKILFDFLNITEETPLQLVSFTATNSNRYNRDSLRVSEGFQFEDAFSDPISIEDTDVRAKLDLRKVLLSGPTSVSAGTEAEYTARLIVENKGRSNATTVSLKDVIQFDILNTFSITNTSTGHPTFNHQTKTLSWEIGKLAPGATAVLDFEMSGFFNTAGERTLETATVNGTDGETGKALRPDSITTKINVVANGGVVGIVNDQSTGFPLSGVVVELKDGATTIATTTTNTNGKYTLTGIPPGSYTIEYSKVNYLTNIQSVSITSGVITRKDVFLTELTGSINGTVTNSGGGAINNATVLLVDTSGNIVDDTTTNIAGSYSFPSISAGQYSIQVTATNFQSATKGVKVTANNTSIVNFVLEPNPGTVQGVVTSEGSLISGALVEILNTADSVVTQTTTNASGEYVVDDLAPGDYKLRVSKELFMTEVLGFNLSAGETETLNVELKPNPGTLTGKVTDSETGDPLSNTTVQVTNGTGVTVGTTMTDINGDYTLTRLAPGSYTVTFIAIGYGSQSIGAKIQSNQTTTLNVEMKQLVGAVSGTVTDTGTNPISGALVEIFSNHILIASTSTDGNGSYIINNLTPGAYTVSVSKENFGTETVGASVLANEITTANVTLTPNPGILTGTVSTSSGDPIQGAVITIKDLRTGANITQVVTNNQGDYTALGLAPGDYSVFAQAEDFQSQRKGAIIQSGQTTITDFTLVANPASVTGTIINATTGLPITDLMIEVKIVDTFGNVVTSTFTDLNGQYEVNNLMPGIYGILASAPNFQTNSASVKLLPGQLTNVNVTLTPEPGTIIGTITDTGGNPLSNVSITIVDDTGFIVGTVLTDTNGNYVFNGLAPGNYTITSIAAGFQSLSTGAIVQSNETTVVDQSLVSNPGSISGTVSPVVEDTLITLSTSDGIPIASTLTNTNGNFQFNNLQPGQFILTASAPNYQTSTVGTTVVSDQTTSATLTMIPNPAEVSGFITDNSGSPITNATIQVLDENGTVLQTGGSDQSGQYVISNLPPGSFTIVVNAQDFSSATGGVTLEPGETVTDANFVLLPDPGSIVGTIIDTDGDPISGATIIIRTADNLQIRSTTTNEFGEYLVEGIAPASYTVVATAPDFSTNFVGVMVSSNLSSIANIILTSTIGDIVGTVVDENGDPITGDNTGIKIFDNSGALLQTLVANVDGTFSVLGLQPGQYLINARATNYAANSVYVTVIANETETITIPLSLLPGTITGRVFNTSTLNGISGAVLTLTTTEGIPIATTITGMNGDYTANNIPPGTVNISAVAEDFGANAVTAVVGPNETTTANIGLTESLGFLTGYITDINTGNAISGAVLLIDKNGAQIATITSNGSGQFLTQGLSPGDYTAVVAADNYTSRTASFTILPNKTTTLSFALSPEPGIVQGRITNFNTGDPIIGATIAVRSLSPSGPIVATTITGANGEYNVATLAPGTYTIVASANRFGAAEATTIVESNQTETVDVKLVPNPGAIEGTISNSNTGTPLSGILVEIFNVDGILVFSTNTDANGFYQFTGLPPLQFRVVTSNPEFQTEEVGVLVVSDETTIVNFGLEPNPGSISGTITDAETATRLVGAEVLVFSAQDIVPIARALTDGLGQYTITGLVPGTYTIVVNAVGYTENSTGSTVLANETTTTNLSLISESAGVSGTVLGTDGKPFKNAVIKIIDSNGVVVGTSAVNANGFYSIGGLSPGTYSIRVAAPDIASQSSGISLVANEVREVNFVLRVSPGTIFGKVTDQTTGEPIVGANVNILDTNGLVIATTATNTLGNYFVDRLAAGSYTVSVTKSSYAKQTKGAIVNTGELTNVNITLSKSMASIFGILRDKDGNRLESIVTGIRLLDNKGLLLQSIVASPNSDFSFLNLSPGQYLISINAEGFQTKVVPVTLVGGETEELDITLFRESGKVIGRVLNESTEVGIAGATIIVKDSANNLVTTSTSNEDGNFNAENLPIGSLFITASRVGFGTKSVSIMVESNETVAATIRLTPNPGSIEGTVTEEGTGQPISSANVQLFNGDVTLFSTVMTQPDGKYLLTNLTPGVYELAVSRQNYGTKIAGAIVVSDEKTTLDFRLPLDPGSLSGVVTNQVTGERVPGVNVLLRWLSPDGEQLASTLTNEKGEYLFEGLTPAIYTVVAYGGGFGSDIASITVRPNQRTVQNLGIFPLPSTVKGRITDADTGMPIQHTFVRLIASSGTIVQRTETDSSGNYMIQGFDPGDYTVAVRNENYGSFAKSFTAEPLGTQILNFELESAFGSVTGKVKDETTQSFVSGVSIIVLDENEVLIANTLTDQNGNYLIKGLAPGTYSIRALAEGCDSDAKRMTIVAGETTIINFLLTPDPATVRGNVTDTKGNPLNDVSIRVYNVDGLLVNLGVTSREGEYVIGYLPGETLTFTASLPGFAPETKVVDVPPNSNLIINFVLGVSDPGSLQGTVTDAATGDGISGATIAIRRNNVIVAEGLTDTNGRYSINELAEGEYTVLVSAEGYETAVDPIFLDQGETLTKNYALEETAPPTPVRPNQYLLFDCKTGKPLMLDGSTKPTVFTLLCVDEKTGCGTFSYKSRRGEIRILLVCIECFRLVPVN